MLLLVSVPEPPQPAVLVQENHDVQAVHEVVMEGEEDVQRCGRLLHGRQTSLLSSRQLPKKTQAAAFCG